MAKEKAKPTTLESRNADAGFHGTLLVGGMPQEQVQVEWETATAALLAAGVRPEHARDMLDSVWGRHTADHVLDGETVAASIQRQRTPFLRAWAYVRQNPHEFG